MLAILLGSQLLSACGSTRHAPAPAPICSLDEAALEQRLAWFDRLIAEAGTGVRELPDGIILRFAPRPGVDGQLIEIVERERECCPAMQWDVTTEAGSDALLLTCRGSARAKDFVITRLRSKAALPQF